MLLAFYYPTAQTFAMKGLPAKVENFVICNNFPFNQKSGAGGRRIKRFEDKGILGI